MYDPDLVRGLFDLWEHTDVKGDPGEPISRWTVPYVNHMLLDHWLPSAGAALDAGCGRGVEAVRMARRGLHVTALDISPGLLRHARRRAETARVADRITFVEADLTGELPLPENHFDICLALTGVLSHTGDRHHQAAANLVASCRPGGILLLGVNSYLGKLRQFLAEAKLDEAEHLAQTHFAHTVSDTFEDYCFTPRELTDLFSRLGCHLQQITSAPSVVAMGYPDLSAAEFARALRFERLFLATPELLGAGEQLVAVFRKGL